MKRIILSTTLTLAAAAAPFAVHGEDFPENPNRLSLGPRFGVNFKAHFNNSGAVNPGAAVAGANHNYNDGYVRVDSSGNAGGQTWNWGYQNASQVVGGNMQFNAVQSTGASSSGEKNTTDDVQFGGELVYQRILGHLPFIQSGRWGLEGGLGYTDLDLRQNSDSSGPVTITTDSYALNGVTPPSAGYNGTFQGPGALLGDTPTRTITSGTATITSREKLSGQLYTIRLGPFAEIDLTEHLILAGSAGITLAPARVNYDFSESTTLAGGGTFVSSGHSSETKFLYGPYVSGMLRYELNKHWGLYLGAQFQSLTDLTQSANGHTARLDQSATVYGTAGASWRF